MVDPDVDMMRLSSSPHPKGYLNRMMPVNGLIVNPNVDVMRFVPHHIRRVI